MFPIEIRSEEVTCSRHRALQNIFWTNENVFLSPFNKQKQRFGELEFEYFGGSDVVYKLIILVLS